ncbi:MAG TPA: serine hydroxymethyltransferase [Acholeplasma sp.]|nr:serine hydroxymethyltransferase [Acholeplasma sp.]
MNDKIIKEAILNEKKRQTENLELIASENFVSLDVLEAQGSVFTHKYAEGYPNKRYYGGCEFADVVETEAIERAKKLFHVKYANVQPHSGSQANMAAIRSLIKPGDKILGMSLDSGGHLTHGYRLSFSGQDYIGATYSVNKETEMIDYDEVLEVAKKEKPQLIIAGYSAYPRVVDFKKFREIADEVGAYLLVDMAHIAGLIAAGVHPSPAKYAHAITSTTHKTLRGPRGGIILTNDPEIAKKIDRNVFPGIQGGPLMHIIAAKAVSFKEAMSDSFVKYQKQVLANSKLLADELNKRGYRIVSGGTDNHLFLVDVYTSANITGRDAEDLLGEVNITVNKNTIPFDTQPPAVGSGIRIGTSAMTTRGLKEKEMVIVAELIDLAIKNRDNKKELNRIKERVIQLVVDFPINAGK